MKRSVVLILAMLSIALSVIGSSACSNSTESKRKAAQANAEKYMEFIKAGDYAGAYANTFHPRYQNATSLESFTKYRKAFADKAGAMRGFNMVMFNPNFDRDQVTFLFKLEVENPQVDMNESVRMILEGSEWKVASVEVQSSSTGVQTNSNASTPIPLPAPSGPKK